MFFNWVHPEKKKEKKAQLWRGDLSLGLGGWDICSIEDTPVPLAQQSSRADQQPLQPSTLLFLLRWSQYAAAPAVITDVLRPSGKLLSATYQHTPPWKLPLCRSPRSLLFLSLFLLTGYLSYFRGCALRGCSLCRWLKLTSNILALALNPRKQEYLLQWLNCTFV